MSIAVSLAVYLGKLLHYIRAASWRLYTVCNCQEKLMVVVTCSVMLQVYFDAGHWLYIEMPDKFNELIQRFAAGDTKQF